VEKEGKREKERGRGRDTACVAGAAKALFLRVIPIAKVEEAVNDEASSGQESDDVALVIVLHPKQNGNKHPQDGADEEPRVRPPRPVDTIEPRVGVCNRNRGERGGRREGGRGGRGKDHPNQTQHTHRRNVKEKTPRIASGMPQAKNWRIFVNI
jgi:hypothetical protein